MDKQELEKILKFLKSAANEGVPLHQRYGWGGFLDLLEQQKAKK